MKRSALSLLLLLIVVAIPMSASQFIDQPFDQVARGAKYIVRAQVVDTYSRWDDAREVIYTYSTLRVTRYFGETTGPDTLVVREVGGTVDGYRQEAIGFPELRQGEQVVLMLAEDGADLRIHAYNQGKYLVGLRNGVETLVADPIQQGDARLGRDGQRFDVAADAFASGAPALTISEFEQMVEDARAGRFDGTAARQQ